jgi:hypothetical protein
VNREDVACYRLYAANCAETAERISDTERKLFFLRMAQAWAKLAAQVERAAASDSEAHLDRYGDQAERYS